jgi:kynureninase
MTKSPKNGPRMTRIGRIRADQDKKNWLVAFCLHPRKSAKSASSVAYCKRKAVSSVAFEATEAYAQHLDVQDELARFRDHFYLPTNQVYLDGNSLGLASVPAERALLRVLEAWKELGIGGWTDAAPPWFTLAEDLGRRMAPLVGAEPDEIIVTNSTTVNLHQLLATLYRPDEVCGTILTDDLSFPSDRYALFSHLRLRGPGPLDHLVFLDSEDGLTLSEEEIVEAMTGDVQMAVLPSVLYQSGQLLDVAWLARRSRERGVLIGFDLSHSVGAVPHALDEWGIDFAFWCTYKYLNGGPGAAGALYLNRRHFGGVPGLAGWFGSRKDAQFEMSRALQPAPDAGALQIGTPNILSMAPLLGSLETITEAGIERIRAKSLRLTAYLMELVEAELAGQGFAFANPREDRRRGGHVALLHPEAARICKALRQAGVIPDFRPPRIVRLAPVALYTSFHDCFEAVRRLKEVMERRLYEHFPTGRDLIP